MQMRSHAIDSIYIMVPKSFSRQGFQKRICRPQPSTITANKLEMHLNSALALAAVTGIAKVTGQFVRGIEYVDKV